MLDNSSLLSLKRCIEAYLMDNCDSGRDLTVSISDVGRMTALIPNWERTNGVSGHYDRIFSFIVSPQDQ